MKKVLIVSPHFPPVNAPDMQRVRLALPHLRALGWEPVVLAVGPDYVEGAVIDPLLEATYPADVRVIRVAGVKPGKTRWAGIGNLWWRCGRALAAAGEALLAVEKFDLVFFSTTQFPAFALGPKWRKWFGVPFVVDYQDPWVTDYYSRTKTRPPGGWLKFTLAQWGAKRDEPRVLRAAAGAVAVSDSYPEMLARLYPWYDARRMRVLPFGASAVDLEVATRHRPATPLVDFDDGYFHQVYTGRSGPDMAESLAMFFRGFARFRATHPETAKLMRFHFIGTGYAPPPLGEEAVMPVARAEGVAEHVTEHCYRVPYFDTLHYLTRAHALIAVGSNDATYSASKIYGYVLSRKPLLLIFHERSLVLKFAREVKAGLALSFAGAQDIDRVAGDVERQWFADGGNTRVAAWSEEAFRAYSAEAMTAGLVEVFESAVSGRT